MQGRLPSWWNEQTGTEAKPEPGVRRVKFRFRFNFTDVSSAEDLRVKLTTGLREATANEVNAVIRWQDGECHASWDDSSTRSRTIKAVERVTSRVREAATRAHRRARE
jgi:hypothetical protein